MNYPKTVSVIVPIYNIVNYIDQCIEAIINQTYTRIEIILVDDGSTDGSSQKCDEWASKDARIKVYHKQNGGLSDARNFGLDRATGDLIYFLDGDDYVDYELIQNTISYFSEDVSLVSFQYFFDYPDGRRIPSSFTPHEYCLYSDEERLRFIVSDLLQYRLGWEAWGRVYRRDIIEENNIRFADNNKIFAEDLYFFLCYVLFATKITVIPDVLYFYRQRDNSIMNNQIDQLNAGRMNELCKELFNYYTQHKESNLICEHYAVIYYLVMKNVIERYQSQNNISITQMRIKLLNDIRDFSYTRIMFHKLRDERRLLYQIYKDVKLMEYTINIAYFYADGNIVLYYFRRYGIAILDRIIDLEYFYRNTIHL